MSTGHMNPGYRDIVTRFHRLRNLQQVGYLSQENDDALAEMNDMDNFRLEDIRKRARAVWSAKPANQTSYQDHFVERFSAVDEPTPSRPTSANRRHNPHPKMVFLTTRLHHCPGYHNADTTMGKPAYQMDASTHPIEQEARAKLREKYVAPQKAMRPYSGLPEGRYLYTPTTPTQPRPQTVPSLHRYLKGAGVREQEDQQQRLMTPDAHGYTTTGRSWGQQPQMDVVSRRVHDIANMATLDRYVHRSKRGDFSMHPEWPPTMEHHRLNGLSSVDMPYSIGRR